MWTHYMKFNDQEIAVSNGVGRRGVCLCIPTETAGTIDDEELAKMVRWFADNASEIEILNIALECNFEEQYISGEELYCIIYSDFANDQEKQRAREELEYRANWRERPEPPKPVKKQVPTKSGYVYLIKSDSDLYKIGRTASLDSRIKSIQGASPIPLELVHAIYSFDYVGLEDDLHERFKDVREHHEWFRLDDEAVEFIKALKNDAIQSKRQAV